MRISDWSSDVCSSDLLQVSDGWERLGNPVHRMRETGTANGADRIVSNQVADIGKHGRIARLQPYHMRDAPLPRKPFEFRRLVRIAAQRDRKSTRLNSSH